MSSGLGDGRAEPVRHRAGGPRLRALPGGRVDGPAVRSRVERRRVSPLAVVTAAPADTMATPAPAARMLVRRRDACVLCGAIPAAAVTFRQCTGRGWRLTVDEVAGPFCRDCGPVVFRDATDETFTTGWWGVPAFFVNWVVLARNLLARRAVLALAPPDRLHDGGPGPLPEGRPVLRRPSALVALAMAGALAAALLVAVRVVA